MTRDHWKQASAVWLRRVGLSRVSRSFGAANRKRQRRFEKVQPKVFQVDSYLPCLLNRPLGWIRRLGTLLCELWFADCVRNRRTVCSDRNSAKPTVHLILYKQKVCAVALNPGCYFISFHAPRFTHGFAARSALLSKRTHNASPAPCGSHCWKSVAIDIGCYAKICNHFQKWQRKKYTVVNGQLRNGRANLTELRDQISKI